MGKPKHPKVYSKNQIKKIRDSGNLVAATLVFASALCKEGKNTLEIDNLLSKFINEKIRIKRFYSLITSRIN